MALGAQLHSFYAQVAKTRTVWLARHDDGGFVIWNRPDGGRVLPVWSSESRVIRLRRHLTELQTAEPVSVDLKTFATKWLNDLTRDSIGLGVNWEGPTASGGELPAKVVIDSVQAASRGRAHQRPNHALDRTRKKARAGHRKR